MMEIGRFNDVIWLSGAAATSDEAALWPGYSTANGVKEADIG